jgi:DNA-directed RNA polymerase specialized sigma24 family protein
MVNESIVQESIERCRRKFWHYNCIVDVESLTVETALRAIMTFDATRGLPFQVYHNLICSRRMKSEIRSANRIKRRSGCPVGEIDGVMENVSTNDTDMVEFEETIKQIEGVVVNKKCIPVIWGIETVDECATRTGLKRNSVKVLASYGRKKIREEIYGK